MGRVNALRQAAIDDAFQDADDELDTCISLLERAKAEMLKQRGDLTSGYIDDISNGVTDLISELRGAKGKLETQYHEPELREAV